MEVGDLLGLMIALVVPSLFFGFIFNRWFKLRERKLEVDATKTAERAAQYATSNATLEQRVRVLEQIVTDRGADTAAQIEALRAPRLSAQEELN